MSESRDISTEQATAAPEQADDLLSKLATAEVDRLLAEAEMERSPKQVEPAAPATSEAAPQEEDEEAAALKRMLGETAEQEIAESLQKSAAEAPAVAAPPVQAPAPPGPAPSSAAAPTQAEEAVSTQLDALFAALKAPDKKPAAPAAVVDVPPGQTTTAPDASVADEDVAIEEKHALTEEEINSPEPASVGLSWWLLPLHWINAPFDFLPAQTRQVLGWIGLLTLCNAGLILAYVYFVQGKK